MTRSATSVEDPPTFHGRGEEGEFGKEYWIRRAGEVRLCVYVQVSESYLLLHLSLSPQLSVQLQQSSEYWTQKVRELSIQLERCQEAHKHMD